MKIAIVGGTAGFGFGLAIRLAHLGETVVVGSRQADKARAAVEKVRQAAGADADVSGDENPEVVKDADLVVVAVPFAGQAGIYDSIKDSLSDRSLVLDATVPLAAEVGGRPTRLLGIWEGSAAQQAKEIISRGTDKRIHVASGFHTLSEDRLADVGREVDADVLVCGDQVAKKKAQELVELLPGARFVDCGPLETARILESLAALLIGINARYKLHPGAGIKITGIPE